MEITARKLQVAHVGAFKKKSPQDSARNVESVYRIMKRDRGFFEGTMADPDTINLTHGRDFLEEDKTYDLVILHSIFHASVLGVARGKVKRWLWLSDRHSVKNWKKRLERTKAQYISVCEGQPHSLSGWHLGEIPGYEILERDEKVTLYKKRRRES